MQKKGIKKQTQLMILACCLVTLLLSGGIAIYGMMNIRSSAVETGQAIGQSAAENSGKALQKDAQRDLTRFLGERSERIDMIFENLGANVSMIADEMSAIQKNPEKYAPMQVQEPQRGNAGVLIPQLQFAPGINRNDADLRQEIGLSANIQDWLLRLNASQDMVASVYIASRNGFGITADNRSEQKFHKGEDVPFAIDFRTRPWYREAAEKKHMIYSSVFADVYSGNLGITCATPYFTAANEVAGVVGAGMFLNRINDIVRTTTLGETGFGFVINKEGRILFSSKTEGTLAPVGNGAGAASLFDAADESLAEAAHDMANGGIGLKEVTVDGVPCYLAYRPLTAMNCSFGIVMAVEEAALSAQATEQVIADSTDSFLNTLNQSIRSSLLAALVLVLFLLLLVPWVSDKLATRFVQPIHELSDGVREIASGNLDKKLDIRTGNEIEHLAVCFNAMTDELQSYMQNLTKAVAEKERIATELNVATNIQESMLPTNFPASEKLNFDIYANMHAAKAVGGDFYDFYLLDSRHLLFTIADVSGKGVPAALFMVISKTILKNFAQIMGGMDDLAPLVSCANDQLCQNNDAMMFVTAFIGMLDLGTGQITYVNAGHNPPLIYRAAEHRFSYLDVKRNFVLGGMPGLSYQGQEITLTPGDRFFLYTDGVTEALNEESELYGEERLLSCLNQAATKELSLEKLLAAVRDSLAEHVKTAEQSDDITMMALSYLGPPEKEA